MKTIIEINGLPVEFTDQKLTRPGAYWMFQCDTGRLFLAHVDYFGNASLSVWIDSYLAPLREIEAVYSSALVPVTEVEKAYREGYTNADVNENPASVEYEFSNARKVVGGLP